MCFESLEVVCCTSGMEKEVKERYNTVGSMKLQVGTVAEASVEEKTRVDAISPTSIWRIRDVSETY